MDEIPELTEAARRGLQRAGVHLMKAAIEIVAGIGAFLEEMGKASDDHDPDEGDEPRQHIPVE
jgi:hypothetical protein